MNKIRRKITVSRFFQFLTYLLSFPLLVHLVLLSSKTMRNDAAFMTLIKSKALLIALVLLAVVSLVQLLVMGIVRKNRFARAAIVGFVAAILVAGPIIGMDTLGKKKFEAIRTEIKESNGEDIGRYTIHATHYAKYADDYRQAQNTWISRYNLSGADGANTGEKNTDGSEATESKEDQAFYSPNGMFSDGYIFSIKQASIILSDYYTLGPKIKANKIEGLGNTTNLSADEFLAAELAKLKTNPNSDWNKYVRGDAESSFAMKDFTYISSADEYDKAYGTEGTAKKYYLTPERLNAILGELGGKLGSTTSTADLLGSVGAIAGMIPSGGSGAGAIIGMISPILNDISAILNSSLSVPVLVDFVNDRNLWTDTIKPMLDEQKITHLLGVAIPDALTPDFVYDLLPSLSFYQSPTTYPMMYFLSNPSLKAYAYAKYYGQEHGAKIGSVLIPKVASEKEVGKVGKITLDTSGQPDPGADSVLKDINFFNNYEKYGPKFYPLFAVRSVLLKFGALAVFCLMLSYAFTQIIDSNYKKLQVLNA